MCISLHLCKLKQEMGFPRFFFFFFFPGFQSSSADFHSCTGEEWFFFPTFANISEPQTLAILIDQE